MSEGPSLELLAQHIQNITSADNSAQAAANEYISAWRSESPISYIEALFQILQSCGDEGLMRGCLTLLIRPFETAKSSLKGDEFLVQKHVPPPDFTIPFLEAICPLLANEDESIRNISTSVFSAAATLLVKMEVEYDPISVLFGLLSEGSSEEICVSVFSALTDIFKSVGFQAEQIKTVYETVIPLLTNDNPTILISIIKLLGSIAPYFFTVFTEGTPELADFLTAMLTLTQEEALFNQCMMFWAETVSFDGYILLRSIPQIMDIVLPVLSGDDEDSVGAAVNFIYCLAYTESELEGESSLNLITSKLEDILNALIQIAVQIESEETERFDCVQSSALDCLNKILEIPGVLEAATEVLMQFIGEGIQGTSGQIEVSMSILETMIYSEKVAQEAIIPQSIECSTAALGSENPRIILCGINLMYAVVTKCPSADDFTQLLGDDLFNILDSDDKELYEGTSTLIQAIIKIEGFSQFEELFNECIGRKSVGSIITARAIVNILQSPELIVPHLAEFMAIASLAIDEDDGGKASEALALSTEGILKAGEDGYPFADSLFQFAKTAYDKFTTPESIQAMAVASIIERKYFPSAMAVLIAYTAENSNSLMMVQSLSAITFHMCRLPLIAQYIGTVVSNVLRICYSTSELFESKISAFQCLNSLIVFQKEEIEKFMDRIVYLFFSATQQYEQIVENTDDERECVEFLDALVEMSTTLMTTVDPDENLLGAGLQLIRYVSNSNAVSGALIGDTLNLLEVLMNINLEQVKQVVESSEQLKTLIQDAAEHIDHEEEKEKLVRIAAALEIPLEEPQEEEPGAEAE